MRLSSHSLDLPDQAISAAQIGAQGITYELVPRILRAQGENCLPLPHLSVDEPLIRQVFTPTVPYQQ